MSESPSQLKDRLWVTLGVSSVVLAFVAIGAWYLAETLVQNVVALSLLAVALGAFIAAVGTSQSRAPGAPTNTQLQQPPPAIHRNGNNAS